MKEVSGILFILALAAVVGGAYLLWRRSIVQAWRMAAARLGCAYLENTFLNPGEIRGPLGDGTLEIAAATSYEDGPGYFHTAAVLTCGNRGSIVLGLRRKSMFEQAFSGQAVAAPTGDAEFDRQFFVLANDPERIETILPPDLRARLRKLEDIEVYVRADRVSVRRAGEQRRTEDLMEMASLAAAISTSLRELPERRRTWAERQQDDALIERGV